MAKIKKSSKSDEKLIYCRRCMKEKKDNNFYSATDAELDKNGFMSICRDCANEIFNDAYLVERNFEKALLKSCKILNVAWVPSAVDAAKTHITKLQSEGKEDISYFGIYKSKMSSFTSINRNLATTYEESISGLENVQINTEEEDESKSYKDLQEFWGDKRSFAEIEYLQSEFNALGGANTDDRSAIILMREICFQLLEVKKKRDLGQSADKELKVLTELMQNSAIRPDQKKVSDGSRSTAAIGMWIADIEKYKPCEWYKDQSIYKDVNNIKEYWDVNILRPFLNFWGIQKNFDFEGAVDREEIPEQSSSSEEE